MLSAFIVDDKPANIETLQQLLTGYCPQVQVLGHARNIADGYRDISGLRPEIVFLDIEMPGGNGFELLRKFSQVTFETIFVTAYDHYAVEAFRQHALDYLLKPIDIEALQQAVMKAGRQTELKQTNERLVKFLLQTQATAGLDTKISLPVQDGYVFIDTKDITRCEASGSYSWFYLTGGKKLMVSMRLKECEQLLPEDRFYRVHNSHIVHIRYVSRYVRGRGGYILMHDDSAVEVAASRKDAFLDLMKRYK